MAIAGCVLLAWVDVDWADCDGPVGRS
eukprot:COSAG01_NODE_68775_length_263_cov_0.628049_1_plen_26_part_10